MNSDQTKNASGSRMTNGTVSGGNGSAPRSRMTNGTVSTKSGASTLSIQYGGGVETVSVPPNVTVTALTPTADKLKLGQSVWCWRKSSRMAR